MGGNLPDWYLALKRVGIEFPELIQDKVKVYEDLERLGLPHHKYIFMDGTEYDERTLRKFLSKDDNYFCRLIPKEKESKRPYALGLKTFEDLLKFIEGYNLGEYIINLVGYGSVVYSGCIISGESGTVIELLKGTGEELFHGTKTPIHAYVDSFLGIVRYKNIEPDTHIEERHLVYRALKYIGGPKNPLSGYYEFDVLEGSEIKFRNYQNEPPFVN